MEKIKNSKKAWKTESDKKYREICACLCMCAKMPIKTEYKCEIIFGIVM